jgi:hypothetical protein
MRNFSGNKNRITDITCQSDGENPFRRFLSIEPLRFPILEPSVDRLFLVKQRYRFHAKVYDFFAFDFN